MSYEYYGDARVNNLARHIITRIGIDYQDDVFFMTESAVSVNFSYRLL